MADKFDLSDLRQAFKARFNEEWEGSDEALSEIVRNSDDIEPKAARHDAIMDDMAMYEAPDEETEDEETVEDEE